MRLIGYARKALITLLAFAGLGLLAWGYLDWRRFYAELYLEEMRAIGAAVDAGATVRYRRAGEPEDRIASDPSNRQAPRFNLNDWIENRDRPPANAPFLGRVESVVIDEHLFLPTLAPLPEQIGRDLFSLPGLKSLGGKFDPSSESDATIEDALGFSLPGLPEAKLTKEAARKPLARGEPVDSATKASTVVRIVDAWSRDRTPETYVLHTEFRPDDDRDAAFPVVQAIDGERLAILLGQSASPTQARRRPNRPDLRFSLTFHDGERYFIVHREPEGWRRIASVDPEATARFTGPEPESWLLPPGAPPRFFGDRRTIDVAFYFEMPDVPDSFDILGRDGEHIVDLERLDDRRWRIALAPHQSTMEGDMRSRGAFFRRRTTNVEAVLREDLGFAVEASRVVIQIAGPSGEPSAEEHYYANRRFAEVEGFVCSEECLELRAQRSVDPRRPAEEVDFAKADFDRTRTAAIVPPSLPDAVFDPLSYDPTRWPDPRPLPFWRTYRVASTIGVVLFVAVTALTLAPRRNGRRSASPASMAEAGPAARRRRLPRFRFGLTSLFAAALLIISVAGIVKEKLDEAERDVTLLSRVAGGHEVERVEPRLPWSWISTPARPIDAPIRRILIEDHHLTPEDELSQADLERLFELPSLESFRYLRSERRDQPGDPLAFAAAALGRPLPPFIDRWKDPTDPPPDPRLRPSDLRSLQDVTDDFMWPSRFDPKQLPSGTLLEESERDAYVESLTARWANSREAFPERYLMAVEPEGFADRYGVTLRDGERYWSCSESRRVYDERFVVRCQDDRRRYGFIPTESGFACIERSLVDFEALRTEYEKENFPSLGGLMTDDDFRFEFSPTRVALPPFAFPRVLKAAAFPEAVAVAALDPAKIARVFRIDERRHRVEFEPTTVELGSDGIKMIRISELAVVVRDDLGCAAEIAEFAREVTLLPGEKKKVDARRFRVENRLMRTPEEIVVPYRTATYSGDERRMELDGNARFAFDFAGIDERIFCSPSMSHLVPLPEPKAPPAFAWWMATSAVALGLLVYAGIGSLRETPKRKATRDEVEPSASEATP